jgi:hypothetical protein
MNNFKVIVLILFLGVFMSGCSLTDNNQNQSQPIFDSNVPVEGDDVVDDVVEETSKTYQYNGELIDVTDGKSIRSLNTGGNASGKVGANYEDGKYLLVAEFKDLPDPQNNEFYEGWIVRRSPLEVISTGVAKKVNGIYVNNYSSNRDLTSHDFYVLTIEPDDNNPAPADHVVEGVLK